MSSERSAAAYYADVKYVDLLNAEKEKHLFSAYNTCGKCAWVYQEGATQTTCPTCASSRNLWAREELAKGALRFVVKVARDYVRRVKGDRHSDDLLLTLISAGNLGLLVAIDRFQVAKGTRFLTYAAWWVREKILEELDNTGLVRVPAYQQKAQRARWKQAGGESEAPFVTLEPITELDHTPGEAETEAHLLDQYGAAAVAAVVRKLPISIRDQYVVSLYLGAREDPRTLKQIAARVGYTPERVRSVKRHVMSVIRSALCAEELDDLEDVFA